MKNVETDDKWALRPGDFRPERLNDILDIIGYSKKAVEQMRITGNLFDSKDEAIEASVAIRAELAKMQFIRQERQGYSRQNGRHPDNSSRSSLSCPIQAGVRSPRGNQLIKNQINMKKTTQPSRHILAVFAIATALGLVCHIARSFERPCPSLIRHDVSWKAFCRSTGRQLADTSETAVNEFLDTWRGSALEEEALIANGIDPWE